MSNKTNKLVPEIFASVITIVAGLLNYLSRIGFENDVLLIIKSISIAFFLIYSPQYILLRLKKATVNGWFISKPLLMLLFLFLLVLAGRISLLLDVEFSYLFALLGVIVFLITKIDCKPEGNLRISFSHYIIFFLFACWATSAYYNNLYIHPLMKEKIVTGALAHRDAIFHSALAGMYKTYGVSSVGLDGLEPLYYHTLSHYVIGSLSGLLGVNTMEFYSLVIPIMLIPIFFISFVWCVKHVENYFNNNSSLFGQLDLKLLFWVTLFVMFALPLPRLLSFPIPNYNIPEIYHFLTSASYFFALLLTFIFISIIFTIDKMIIINIGSTSKFLFLLFICLLSGLYFCISYAKLSFLYLIIICYGYLFVRLELYRKIVANVLLGTFSLVVAYMFLFVIQSQNVHINNINDSIFLFYKAEFLQYPLYIFPSLIYISIRIYILRIKSFFELFRALGQKCLIDVELIILLIIISFIPPYPYFKGIQMYIAYILILSNLDQFLDRVYDNKKPTNYLVKS